MNTMTYNGYHARIEFDAEDEVFFGKIAGISDVIGFHGDSVAELKKAFHEAVDDYLETCRKIGKEPQRPYSGKMMFRVAPEVHRRAALAAELSERVSTSGQKRCWKKPPAILPRRACRRSAVAAIVVPFTELPIGVSDELAFPSVHSAII